jgi:hypothetical protein
MSWPSRGSPMAQASARISLHELTDNDQFGDSSYIQKNNESKVSLRALSAPPNTE